jgi:hypothetical protein
MLLVTNKIFQTYKVDTQIGIIYPEILVLSLTTNGWIFIILTIQYKMCGAVD